MSLILKIIQWFLGSGATSERSNPTSDLPIRHSEPPITPSRTYDFDRSKFFYRYRLIFGVLNQSQVDGIGLILDYCTSEHTFTLEQVAYILATAKHESANTYQPVRERRAGVTQLKLRKIQDRYWASGYYGRGLVQLTWLSNYQKFSPIVDGDLVKSPDLALSPGISVKILCLGMEQGLFTGKKLSQYVNEDQCDYVGARKVVNGTDKASEIAKIAKQIETCLSFRKI